MSHITLTSFTVSDGHFQATLETKKMFRKHKIVAAGKFLGGPCITNFGYVSDVPVDGEQVKKVVKEGWRVFYKEVQ